VKENVDALRLRLETLIDAYQSVILANAEATRFILMLM
jgi:hypothetical protein